MNVWLVVFILCTIIFMKKMGHAQNGTKNYICEMGDVNSNLILFLSLVFGYVFMAFEYLVFLLILA